MRESEGGGGVHQTVLNPDENSCSIPGTSFGLRTQLRKLIDPVREVNLNILNQIYQHKLKDFMQGTFA